MFETILLAALSGGDIAAIVGSVTGLIGALWGIIKYYDTKREKKAQLEKDEHKQEIEKYELQLAEERENQQKTLSMVTDTLVNLELSNTQQQESINDLTYSMQSVKQEIGTLHEKINNQRLEMCENEKDRLRFEIVTFAEGLRRGNKLTLETYEYICHAYDKYRLLGGNSFIVSQMEYINKIKDQMDQKGWE